MTCFFYMAASLHSDIQETWVGTRGIANDPPLSLYLNSLYFAL